MGMSENRESLVRNLSSWEIDEFQPIFGGSMKYERVRIHENNPWPDRIDRLGRKLKRMPPPSEHSHNAVTLGNHCYFPVDLPRELPDPEDPINYKVDWLVHELTHVWQYQQIGWSYIWKALIAQFKEKAKAYDFGGEEGLHKSRQKSIKFKDFNPEQQGNIVQSYYTRKRLNKDISAWQPFIDELKQPG